ncbi:MAG: helix-turn-helix transcriptional regulator [Gammaproteobacteria bacterium]|nr:helix-turn-helix transcriptional regulator [Gammaproteobacteria bacterium]
MTISDERVSTLLQSFAARLRAERLAQNLTQRELAERIGVSIKTVANAEDSGQISMETLLRALDGLGRLDDLQRLLPDNGPSPIALAERKGRRRVRASSAPKAEQDGWSW